MKLLTLSLLIAVGAGACAQSTVDGNDQPANNAAPSVAEKPAPTETSETECKICDLDFDSYKGELEKKEVEGLLLALNDEFLATAIYKGVNEKFDDPRPFVNIIKAEMTHADRLKGLFEQYKLPVPENKWLGNAPSFETVLDACKAGIVAEIANRDLYERLFKSTTREDILIVYKNLQRASEENHKPAFERCASGGGGRGMDNRKGLGRGSN